MLIKNNSLFDENDRYTEDALYLDSFIKELVTKALEDYFLEGHSAREIQYIAQSAIVDICLDLVLLPNDKSKENILKTREYKNQQIIEAKLW